MAKITGSSSINPYATFLTALPGIAALILVLMRTSDKASTLSNGGFTPGMGTSLFTTANVGIGTNNPAGKLHVVGNAYVTTGNLGVGTISTASKLTVLETAAVSSYITTIRGTNVQNNGLLVDLASDSGSTDLLRMRSANSSKFAVYTDGQVEIGNTLEDGGLSIYGDLMIDSNSSSNSSLLIDAHGSSNNGMFLTSSGKMVLGTVSQASLSTTLSAPYKLQVFGDINIVGDIYKDGILSGGDGGGAGLVVVSEYLPNLTVGGTLTVENEIRSNNFLTVTKDTLIGGNLTVLNSGAIGGNLTVDGRGNFTDLFVTKDIFFNGNIYQDGELFGGTNTGTVTGVTKYSDVNTIVLAASDNDWISNSPIYQEGRTITTSTMGAYLEKTFVITREGTYILNVNYLLGPDFGFATLLIDGLALTVNSEPQFTDLDLYSPWGSTTPNMLISYTVSLQTGVHTIRIINQGATRLKNPQSGGYRVGLGDSSLLYIPVAKSPTQVETRISINNLKPEDSPGWLSVNTNLTTVTNGLILTSGKQYDGFYRDVNINIEGSYLMNFVLPLDPSYGRILIEIIGPSGPDSVTTPLDILDLYTSIGGAGSSRIIKSYSKILSTGTYRLRLTNPGTKNGASVGYTIGAGEINMILINAGLSSFGTVIFSTLKGDVIENDADGWIGTNTTNQDKGGFSRFIPTTGFLNYTNESFGEYNLFSSNTTDYLNMKVMNNDTRDVYIAYTDKITGFLFVKKLANGLTDNYETTAANIINLSSLTIDNSITINIGLDLSYVVGNTVVVASQSNPSDYFELVVISYTSSTGVMIGTIQTIEGTTTNGAWDVYLKTAEGGKYLWVPLADKNPNPTYGSINPFVTQNHVVTIDNVTENELNYSTQYVSLAVRKIGSVEYIYVAFIQQQDIYSKVSDDNVNPQLNSTFALDSKVRVKQYIDDGTPGAPYWKFVSFDPENSPTVSDGPAAHLNLQIDALGAPIIAYSNLDSYDKTTSNANKLVVQRWNSTANVWQYIIDGNLTVNTVTKNGVTPGGAYFLSMGIGGIELPNYVQSSAIPVVTKTTSTTGIIMGNFNVGQELALTIPSGLEKETGVKLYPNGCRLKVYRTSDTTKYFIITVTDYTTTVLKGTILNINGAGSFSDWTIDYTTTTVLKNQIYVAFSDGNPRSTDEDPNVTNGLSVYTYEMSDTLHYFRWRYLGPLASKGTVDFINLLVFTSTVPTDISDKIYIGFEDSYINAGSVVKFVPANPLADPPGKDSWSYVGVPGFTNGPVHNLVMDGRWIAGTTNAPELYVGYRDGREDPLGKTYRNRMSVMYHDGTFDEIWDYINPVVDAGNYNATSSTTLNLTAQDIGKLMTTDLTLNQPGKLYTIGDTVDIVDSVSSNNSLKIRVSSFVSNAINGTILSKTGSGSVSSWNLTVEVVNDDTRHFTTGPVAETALAIRNFDLPEILTIYRLGEPIVYHGSYITIFDEIDDNSLIYPQSGSEGFGLEYEYFFPFTTTYRITVEYILGREFGVSRMRLNGVIIGDPVDCYLEDVTPKIWTRTVGYTVTLFAGNNNIRLENAGLKNGSSQGYNIGVASVKIEYFSVTRSGDMDNLTVTGSTALNVATINSLSVANFTGIETLTVGTEVNSLVRLGNGINPATSVPIPMAMLAISDTAQDLTFTNYQTAGGVDFQITTLRNSTSWEVATANVSTNQNTITISNHGLSTGDALRYNTNSGAAISPLTNDTIYYVRIVDPNGFQLYDTAENARNGSSPTGLIDLTTAGSNSQTFSTIAGLSTTSGMKLNRYGRFGIGVDIDNVSTAFGVKANLISGALASLENTNPEGDGLLIKTASNSFRNRYPLRVQAGTSNTFTLTSDGFMGLGVDPNNMRRQFTISGNAFMQGGYLDLGSSATSNSSINMSNGKATITYSGSNLQIRTTDPSMTLRTGASSVIIDDISKTISAPDFQLNSKNTAKAWFYLPSPSSAPSGDSFFNISAISRIRAGVYSVRMETPLSSERYAVVATANANNGSLNVMVNNSSSYIFVVVVRDIYGFEKDPGSLNCVVFGL